MKTSDTKLAMIGAVSVRWPDSNINVAWRLLREAIVDIREVVRQADIQIELKEDDRDLSDVGRLRAIGAIGIATIDHLAELSSVKKAEEGVRRILDAVVKGAEMPGAPTELGDALQAQEIRAHIARQAKPLAAALQLKNDSRVVAAISSAPSFLSGLTDEQKAVFLTQAELALFPGAAGQKNELLEAQAAVREAVGQAQRMVGDMAQLLQKKPGEWDLQPVARRAAA